MPRKLNVCNPNKTLLSELVMDGTQQGRKNCLSSSMQRVKGSWSCSPAAPGGCEAQPGIWLADPCIWLCYYKGSPDKSYFVKPFCCWHSLNYLEGQKNTWTSVSLQQSVRNSSFWLVVNQMCERTNKDRSLVFDAKPAFQRSQWISWSHVGEKHFRENENPISPWCLHAVTVRCFLTLAHECDCFQLLVSLPISSFQSIIKL